MGNRTVVIVDYGIGNLFNVQRAFDAIGADAKISEDAIDVLQAERVVVPGVGAFGEGMKGLRDRALVEPLLEFAASGRPLFGICLGMQLLMSESDELGHEKGLNLVSGRVTRLQTSATEGRPPKIPHIGWNTIRSRSADAGTERRSILDHLEPNASMYFLHSYAVHPDNPEWIAGETEYGGEMFCSLFQKENILGCQPHPERSGDVGLQIFKNFLAI